MCNLDFFFQAEDGIRDAQESRGLGDVYKRQLQYLLSPFTVFACLERIATLSHSVKAVEIYHTRDENARKLSIIKKKINFPPRLGWKQVHEKIITLCLAI